jgi:hypothetical protein
MMNNTKHLSIFIMLVIAAAFVICGCARTKQARSVNQSGFLGDYSMLEKGKKGEALQIYKNPDADWPSYTKIMLDPIAIWSRVDKRIDSAPQEDLQRVANNFYSLISQELSKDYEMVKEPGPRTMRIQIALTDVEKSWAAVNTVTSVVPMGIAVSTAKDFITGKPSFVGEVSAEVKALDARTGQVLAMAVDDRVGSNSIRASVDNWDDVNKILELWSRLMRFRLCKFRGDKDCTAPNE